LHALPCFPIKHCRLHIAGVVTVRLVPCRKLRQ
jgi:hypothetical protein